MEMQNTPPLAKKNSMHVFCDAGRQNAHTTEANIIYIQLLSILLLYYVLVVLGSILFLVLRR
jgi:hypothetical protein